MSEPKIDKHDLLILNDDMILTNTGVIDRTEKVKYCFDSYSRSYSFSTTGGLWETLFKNNANYNIRVLVDTKNPLPLAGGLNKTAALNYGKYFSLNLIDKQKSAGHVEYYDETSLKSRYPKLQCSWFHQENGSIQFRIEELIAFNGSNTEVRTRFIHSERDPIKKEFTHLDGACKVYDIESYKKRYMVSLLRAEHAPKYTKIFRIDGKISSGIWIDLVYRYFYPNILINELFEKNK